MKKYLDFIKEDFVGMGSYYMYPYAYNTIEDPDRGKTGNIEYHKLENNFQTIQEELKILIREELEKKNNTVTDKDVEEVLSRFFSLGGNKNREIKLISDNCDNPKECAKKIFDTYIKYVRINFYNKDEINENNQIDKFNGKYGFFMFLEVIDDMKNSFIKEDYLNTGNYIIFFTTDKIDDKQLLTDKLEYKKSLNIAYNTLIHIRNLRLSFYFGIKNHILEYGFHDDLKRMIYKVGRFKVDSYLINNLSSYKCLSLIQYIIKNIKLKNLYLLNKIKDDLKTFIDDRKDNIKVLDNDRMSKIINKIEFEKFNTIDIREFFNKWCSKFNWYYKIYNYVDEDENNYIFYIKTKKTDKELNDLKRFTDIKRITEDKETEVPVVRDKMITEPQKASKLKNVKKKKTNTTLDKNRNLIKYYKELHRAIKRIDNDQSKDKSYLTRHIYDIVYKFNKPFNIVKQDIYNMNQMLNKNPNFIENEENRLLNK